MAGRDITEGDDNVWALAEDGLPIARGIMDVGVATSTATWQNTDVSYDVAVGGQPFIYAINDTRPYVRQTAPFKKNSLIIRLNLVSSRSLVGGFAASRLFILVLVLNSMTHQRVKQFRIVLLKAKVLTYGLRDR